jgi:hypothetical protein
MALLLNGLETFLALAALIVSILVSWQAIRLTKNLHHESHLVSVEAFQRSRFDALFAAVDKVLSSIADLKTDMLPYSEASKHAESRPMSDEALEYDRSVQRTAYLMNVHRSMEHLFAHRKSLDVALVGLPTLAASREPANGSDLAATKLNLEFTSSWLGGCVMALYFALVTKTLADGSTQLKTDLAVFGKIENEWDQKGRPSTKPERVQYLTSIRDGWFDHRSKQVVTREEALAAGIHNEPGRPDSAANVAYYFLEAAERQLVNEAKELSRLYLESQIRPLRPQERDSDRSSRRLRQGRTGHAIP